MSTLDQAARALGRLLKGYEKKNTLMPARMGDGSGNVRASRANYSVVRIGSLPPTEVLNLRGVPEIDNLPVSVGYIVPGHERGRKMEILSTDTQRLALVLSSSVHYGSGVTPTGVTGGWIGAHAANHMLGHPEAVVNDPVYIQKRAFIPMMAYITSPASMRLNVHPEFYAYGDGWRYFGGGVTDDLSSYRPSSIYQNRIVSIYINGATNQLAYVAGAPYVASPSQDTISLIPEPPSGSVPVCAVVLSASTTEIIETSLYDLRLIFGSIGGSVIPAFDDTEGDPSLVDPDLGAFDGLSVYPSRFDHRHGTNLFRTNMPSGVVASGVHSSGVSSGVARDDHKHFYTFSDTSDPLLVALASSSGSALWPSRRDHVHGMGTGVVPQYALTTGVVSQLHAQMHNLWSVDHPDINTGDSRNDGDVITWDQATLKWIASPPSVSAGFNHDHTGAGDGGTLTSGVIDNFLDFEEGASPGTPPSGSVRLYAKTDGVLYFKDDAGNETEIGSGSGGGDDLLALAYAIAF